MYDEKEEFVGFNEFEIAWFVAAFVAAALAWRVARLIFSSADRDAESSCSKLVVSIRSASSASRSRTIDWSNGLAFCITET